MFSNAVFTQGKGAVPEDTKTILKWTANNGWMRFVIGVDVKMAYLETLLACIFNDAFGSYLYENNFILNIFENLSVRLDLI